MDADVHPPAVSRQEDRGGAVMSHKKIERPEYLYENLERLPKLLKERGLLQRELEEQAGLPKKQTTRWICGESLPSSPNYNRMAEFFGWRLWE